MMMPATCRAAAIAAAEQMARALGSQGEPAQVQRAGLCAAAGNNGVPG